MLTITSRGSFAAIGLAFLASAAACGHADDHPSPTGPTGTRPSVSSKTAAAGTGALDKRQLKIPAPSLVAPVDGFQFRPTVPIVLRVAPLDPIYDGLPIAIEMEVFNPAGARVASPTIPWGSSETSVTITPPLAPNTTYTWHARASLGPGPGAWSVTRSFTSAHEDVPSLLVGETPITTIQNAVDSTLLFRVKKLTEPNLPADLAYELEIRSAIGELLGTVMRPPDARSETTALTALMPLPGGVLLTSRARARTSDLVGPWSAITTLIIPQTLTLSGPNATLELAHSTQITATFKQRGTTVNCAAAADWRIDNPTAASISTTGLYTALFPGLVTLTGTCDSAVATKISTSIETWTGSFHIDSCAPSCPSGYTLGQNKSYSIAISGRGPGANQVSTAAGSGTLTSDGDVLIDMYTDSLSSCGADSPSPGTRTSYHIVGIAMQVTTQPLSCTTKLPTSGTIRTVVGTTARLHRP